MSTKTTIDPRVTLIAAVAENGAIGAENALLYHLPNDLRRFKQLTTGHTVIMGRRTYQSLPHGALPNRRNIVLSKTAQSTAFPNCEVYDSLPAALAACSDNEEIFVIGGATVYAAALPFAARMALTLVHDHPTHADAYFPAYGEEWYANHREDHDKDEQHAVAYSFIDLLHR